MKILRHWSRFVTWLIIISFLVFLFIINNHHQKNIFLNWISKNEDLIQQKISYPKRFNMGKCLPVFGKIVLFVAFIEESMKNNYHVAQETLKCYLKGTDYEVLMVDLYNDERVKKECPNNTEVFFLKHCAAAAYLRDTDWMVVLDADSGVVNPNHCFEEWIDNRVDILFYERVFNWEIASGNYLIRNSNFSYDFLRKWGNFEFSQPQSWNGADNGALQIHLFETLIPNAKNEIETCNYYWHNATDYDSYMSFVTCCKLGLGSSRFWPGKIRIYRRAHGWIRDWYTADDKFCEKDFMFHGWKLNRIETNGWQSPFNITINSTFCGKGFDGWNYRENMNVSCQLIGKELASFEKHHQANFPKIARVLPYLELPDIGKCFPNCENN